MEKMPLSEFDKDYDWVNEPLKKHLLVEIDMKPEEESRLNTFLDKFAKTDCDYNEGCRSDTCRFCGTPDKWVNLFGFGNLCDLVLSYIGNDRQLKKAK